MLAVHRLLVFNVVLTVATAALQIDKAERPALAKHDSSTLDLVFVIDATGSMGSYIHSATRNIRLIVEEIVASEKSDIRLGLVEYRDHPPQDETFVTRVHDFTPNVLEMKGWLEQCTADGGGDGPEAVADALHEALQLSWRHEATKICILISDAPPHGLDTNGDTFPNGSPNGFDPIKIVQAMAERGITLYSVGVEPPIVPYRDFFMALAYKTGGQYVPMVNAGLLAQVIIGGVREEISLDRLMQNAQEGILREMRQAAAEELDEHQTATRLNDYILSRNIRVHQMKNQAGEISSTAAKLYSKCDDMDELRMEFKRTPASGDFDFTGGRSARAEVATEEELDYALSTDEEVSVEQTKRIVQKMKAYL